MASEKSIRRTDYSYLYVNEQDHVTLCRETVCDCRSYPVCRLCGGDVQYDVHCDGDDTFEVKKSDLEHGILSHRDHLREYKDMWMLVTQFYQTSYLPIEIDDIIPSIRPTMELDCGDGGVEKWSAASYLGSYALWRDLLCRRIGRDVAAMVAQYVVGDRDPDSPPGGLVYSVMRDGEDVKFCQIGPWSFSPSWMCWVRDYYSPAMRKRRAGEGLLKLPPHSSPSKWLRYLKFSLSLVQHNLPESFKDEDVTIGFTRFFDSYTIRLNFKGYYIWQWSYSCIKDIEDDMDKLLGEEYCPELSVCFSSFDV